MPARKVTERLAPVFAMVVFLSGSGVLAASNQYEPVASHSGGQRHVQRIAHALSWQSSRRLGQASTSCPASLQPRIAWEFCYDPHRFSQAASGLPFAPVDPRTSVQRAAHLTPQLVVSSRIAFPPTNGARFPLGPPRQIYEYSGKIPSTQDKQGPPRRAATFVRVIESMVFEPGAGVHLQRTGAPGTWFFTANLPRQHVTFEVDSNGPKEAVRAIGTALVAAEKRLRVPPTAPSRVYVLAPRSVHAGMPGTFWVLVAPRWGTYPGLAYDFDFTLGGSWRTPRTITPDGTQACGGDNVAEQPSRRRGRWVFNWGDCTELGLVLTPRGTGPHSLTIYGYSVPLTPKGQLDRQHETPAPGSGYKWRGVVLP